MSKFYEFDPVGPAGQGKTATVKAFCAAENIAWNDIPLSTEPTDFVVRIKQQIAETFTKEILDGGIRTEEHFWQLARALLKHEILHALNGTL